MLCNITQNVLPNFSPREINERAVLARKIVVAALKVVITMGFFLATKMLYLATSSVIKVAKLSFEEHRERES